MNFSNIMRDTKSCFLNQDKWIFKTTLHFKYQHDANLIYNKTLNIFCVSNSWP